MPKPRTMSADQLGELVANLGMQELACLNADELCRVEGGRARLTTPSDEDLLGLNAGELRVDVRPY